MQSSCMLTGEAQDELRQAEESTRSQLDKELPVTLKDLHRYVTHVEKLYRALDKAELKTLLLLLSGAQKSRIFSTNFAIGFFRGAGAMLGVALVFALILVVAFNSPYQDQILYALSQIF